VKKTLLALALLALSALSLAQAPKQEAVALLAQKNAAEAVPHSPLSTTECAFTFTSGTGLTFLKYCVTANGNITSFESPSGQEQINAGTAGEGYGMCDFTGGTGYNDYAGFGDSANWEPATVVSQSAKSVKIARTTSDGVWKLTQTISQIGGTSPYAKIAMTLTNNSSVTRQGQLIRYADVDAASISQNNFDLTVNSAFGWNPGREPAGSGLMLQNVGNTIHPLAFTQEVPDGPVPCVPFAHMSNSTQIASDGSVAILYRFQIAAHRSQTVTVSYRPM